MKCVNLEGINKEVNDKGRRKRSFVRITLLTAAILFIVTSYIGSIKVIGNEYEKGNIKDRYICERCIGRDTCFISYKVDPCEVIDGRVQCILLLTSVLAFILITFIVHMYDTYFFQTYTLKDWLLGY